MKPVVYYGQNREDIIIKAFFPDVKKGFYVDVGAYHPVIDSVTKLFYDEGWSGINIEPQANQCKLFDKQRKRDINLPVGISDKPGTLKLRQYESGGLSTFSDKMKKDYQKEGFADETGGYKDIEAAVDTLKNVFNKHNVEKIHFMKVDVEGFEYEVLQGNDWQKYRPELICIEANHVAKDWRKTLDKAGYTLAFFDGLNEYYLEPASLNRKKLFEETFPEVLVGAPLISYGWKQQVDELTRRIENYQTHVDGQAEAISRLEREAQEKQENIRSIRFLASKLKYELTERIKQLFSKK